MRMCSGRWVGPERWTVWTVFGVAAADVGWEQEHAQA